MKLDQIPFQPIDWNALAPTQHAGESGGATWRTRECGDVRTRIVEYSPGYVADHWCERGHVVFVFEGEMTTELADGRSFTARAGQGYVVSTGDGAHRSRTTTGAKLFIVD
ncbi:MAG: DHCW motif cupin fold protein [Polyangiaceae bacterium]|nr:DHCW motif cupin fold protein [Polyangiaceae bacterium]